MLKNSWLFPLIESIHLVGMATFVGTVLLADFRLVAAQKMVRWTNAGLALVLLTGVVLFSADAARYVHNPAFRFKTVVFVLAMVSYFTLRSKSRLAAILSLILWTCVVLGGRAIADFDI
jgi:hypothetical protein